MGYITLDYPNAIKLLPPKVAFEGSNVCNFTLVRDNTNKKVVLD